MSVANPFWRAPRIHGELLKLGIDVGQTTVAKYMARRRRPPSQGWKTFLRNHADGIASIDLFVVPTISFRLLYGLLVLRHSRRELLWLGVTAHPNAEWIARQLTEACGWSEPPRYIIRDRDGAYGEAFMAAPARAHVLAEQLNQGDRLIQVQPQRPFLLPKARSGIGRLAAPLQVRVGIATELVVVGASGGFPRRQLSSIHLRGRSERGRSRIRDRPISAGSPWDALRSSSAAARAGVAASFGRPTAPASRRPLAQSRSRRKQGAGLVKVETQTVPSANPLKLLAGATGLEPATSGVTGHLSAGIPKLFQ
jgi:hypothetical protein